MGRKLPSTPKSRVRAALRQLWLRSRERAAALKRSGNTCECCGVKASAAKGREVKLEVHHLNGIDWENLIDRFYKTLLCDPKHLMPLCKECHDRLHQTGEL
jgi:predicted HNH restriction endonuclease